MDLKSSGEDNILYEREQSKDFRITDSTSSNENISKDSELWAIAGHIHTEHLRKVGTILHFPSAKLNHLEGIYSKQPQQMFYILLKKWCDVVKTKYENHRRLLAKALFEADYKNISDSMYKDIREVTIPDHLTDDLSDVCFDIQNSNETRSTRSDQAELGHDGPLTESHSNVSRKEYMLNMLKELKLEEFYPSKILLPMINEIIGKSTDEEVTIESIPWLLLRKFMNLNYEGREADLNALYECQDDEHDDFSSDRSEKTVKPLHPLDVFLLTFLCCDPILQQELVSKMFFCRLAVPFIYRTLEDKLIMSKWAFRKIVINRKKDGEWVEEDALSQDIKIVTFLRIGPSTHETVSKSNMINEVLSNQKHPTFFNKKACMSFETEKLITNGMVEASWFIPSNSDSVNDFQDVVMFLNLRGNCLQYEEEVRTVSSISNVVIVLINVNSLDESKIVQNLEKIHSFDKCIIYGIESRKEETGDITKVKSFRKQFMLKKEDTIKVGGEISFTIAQRFHRKIRKSLMNSKAKKFAKVISGINFGDEDFSNEGYKMSKDIIDFINKQPDKRTLFPLQDKIWKELCLCTKSLLRSKLEIDRNAWRIFKDEIEQKQFDLIEKSETLQHFTRNMLSTSKLKESNNENRFFIAWMKTFMDERLRSNQKYNQKPLSLKFTHCYDHFIREMGQAFSIQVQDTFAHKHTYRREVSIYQKFVSNMLQFGFPFELMDGDTGMVPLVWVEAVLLQLKEDIGDQNVYVISVLGIQSSGKSTLLNTMFGLHFAVSSGRCTRGVFMQLIRVTGETLPFNYLLILDTEGIRASLNHKRRVFENELATFAIGLGNITILNIKGENTSEIENFLQIAVHACLRLKMVNKNLKMQQRCVFVHQNVDANDADGRLKDDRDNLMHRLDELVKDADLSEDLSDISSFDQVIGIEPESDVWYFPNLWQGAPPMATVALGYSKKVALLKHHILHEIAKSHGTSYSLTNTIIRIGDFSRGILAEDFVFSFRNSLEIKVYRQMEYYFQSLTWKLECQADEFVSTTVRKRIAFLERENIDSVCEKNTEELKIYLTKKFSMAEGDFKDFVNKHRLKNIMEQYTERRILEIQELKRQLIQKGTNDIQDLKSSHQFSLDQISKRTRHNKELKEKAQSYVANCKANALSDKDTDSLFDEIWNNWLIGIDSNNDENPLRVEEIIDKILFDVLKTEKPLLCKETQKMKPFRDKYRDMNALADSVELNQLQDDHIKLTLSPGDDQIKDVVLMDYKIRARFTINIIMSKIDKYISSLHEEYRQFKDTYVKHVFWILMESLDINNSNTNSSFLLTKALRVKLAVHIKMYIVEDFTCLNNQWQNKNDMKKQMQSEKETYSKYFISLVKDQATEVRMSQLFLRNIERFIIETVSHELPNDVVKSIIPDTYNTKYSLMIAVMTHLVRKADFNEFMQYIDDSRSYALNWLTTYINEDIFTKNGQDNKYTTLAESSITRICMKIKKIMSIEVIKTSDNKKTHTRMYEWCNIFEKILKESYTVTKGTFLTDIGDERVDLCSFKELIFNEFDEVEKKVKNRFKSEVAENVKWTNSPYQKVFDHLWGCTAKCPFCKEICQRRYNHTGEAHSCIQHRPPGLIGIRQIITHGMAMMCCNCLVSSDKTFRCNAIDTSFRCQNSGKDGFSCLHQYRKYTEVVHDWIIEPSSLAEPPKYWTWFISKFEKELCEMYGYKALEHQDKWKNITADEAIQSFIIRDEVSPN